MKNNQLRESPDMFNIMILKKKIIKNRLLIKLTEVAKILLEEGSNWRFRCCDSERSEARPQTCQNLNNETVLRRTIRI